MPGQDVQNDTGRMDTMRYRLGTSGFYRINPIGQHGAQDVDHLPITAGLTFQLALHSADRDRQVLDTDAGTAWNPSNGPT